jgi:ribonuclease D
MNNFNPDIIKRIEMDYHDISPSFLKLVRASKVVAWDIETTGLNWDSDIIATCQLFVPPDAISIVKADGQVPEYMRQILSDKRIKKVFHYAIFDLRFMCYKWDVFVENVACTKIASKLLSPEKPEHSLKSLLYQYLNIMIDKSERLSNWLSDNLSEEQITYAVQDVIYLLDLLNILEENLKSNQLLDLARRCFAHIPTKVALDILQYPDIYTY